MTPGAQELSLDESVGLVSRLAAQDGDDRFVEFLDSPKRRGRLAALHHLAGGSPRLWMVLAGCASVDLLDDLVPAVEELLENLVTFYQQRLWELPGNEQKLVRALGTGAPSAAVGELAEACGLDERTAATALGRLADTGSVRREKLPRTDQPKSWYRLREPLVRHHFPYRLTDGEPRRLIVDILGIWFDSDERHGHLAGVEAASVAERHVLAAHRLDPPRQSDCGYADRDIDRLLAGARRGIHDAESVGPRTPACSSRRPSPRSEGPPRTYGVSRMPVLAVGRQRRRPGCLPNCGSSLTAGRERAVSNYAVIVVNSPEVAGITAITVH